MLQRKFIPIGVFIILVVALRIALLAPQRLDRSEFIELMAKLENADKVIIETGFGTTTLEGKDARSLLEHLKSGKRKTHYNLMKKMSNSDIQIYAKNAEVMRLRTFFGSIYAYKDYYFEMSDDLLPNLIEGRGGIFPTSLKDFGEAKQKEPL